MPISLDGNSYYIFQNNYNEVPSKFVDEAVGITGATLWSEAETGVGDALVEKRYRLTLLLTTTEVETLEASFAKTGALDLVDERGVHRDPLAGEGVLFKSMSEPKPMAQGGWASRNRFLVDVELVVERAGS